MHIKCFKLVTRFTDFTYFIYILTSLPVILCNVIVQGYFFYFISFLNSSLNHFTSFEQFSFFNFFLVISWPLQCFQIKTFPGNIFGYNTRTLPAIQMFYNILRDV